MWRFLLCAIALGTLVPAGLLAEEGAPTHPVPSNLSVIEAVIEAAAPRADTIQPSDTIQEIRLADGSRIYARVVAVTDERITVETAGGVRIEIERHQIRSLRPARGQVVNGQFWRTDPNHTRLFFAPTARALDLGEGYLASYMLFFPFVAYGVTDRFTMAGGTPIFPGLMGELFYLAPKVTLVSQPGIDLAVGTLAFFSTREIDEGSVGILYGNGTFGDIEQSFTAGAGWGFALGGGDSRISNDPVFMLGGEFRTGESTKLLTENWFYSGGGGGGILTGGMRFFGERLSADLGIGLGVDDGGAHCCLPLVNFVYMWGGR